MPESWLGIVVSSDYATIVEATVDGADDLTIQSDSTWKLQTGSRAAAYNLMYKRLSDYAREREIDLIVFKESAVPKSGVKKGHLTSAELRGVLMAAATAASTVELISKVRITKTFGERSVDEYVKDDEFWKQIPGKPIRSGSREAAVLLLAVQKKKYD